jgi:hypothetical protein
VATNADSALPELEAPETQTQLREWAFAKVVLETVDVGVAYRDVYDPGEPVTAYHHARGANLLSRPEVGKLIQRLAPPALVAAGVERGFALRRLIQTIEADITDFVDEAVKLDDEGKEIEPTGAFMSLAEIKKNLPPEKRRLIRKFRETYNAKTGVLVKREIELEPKSQALELLARIQQLVQPSNLNIMNSETIINVISVAHSKATKRADTIRATLEGSKTMGQMQRSSKAQALIEHEPIVKPKPAPFLDPASPDGYVPEEP